MKAFPLDVRGAVRVPVVHHLLSRARWEADHQATALVLTVPFRIPHVGVWRASEDLAKGGHWAERVPVKGHTLEIEGLAREMDVCS